jgi:hypothetical protein
MPDKIQDKDIQDAINKVGTYNEGPGAPPPIVQDAGKIWRGMKEVGGKVALGQSIAAAQEGMPMANAAWYVGGGNPQKPLQDVITQSSAAMAPNIPIGIGGSQPSPAQVNPQPWAPLAKEGNKANFDAVYGIPKTPEPSPESKVALPGLPAGQTTAQPVDDNAPNWASKNGWGISGMKIDGVRTAPKTEDRTAVRITDIPSRPFEGGYGSEIVNGKVVSVKAGNRGIRPELATDTSDTTLVSNPNYHKGIVEENGYSHVDNRKYIEVPNENKGGKVPLLEAIGIPKKEPTGIFEKQIFDIKKDPANWKLGTFSPAAQAKIDKLTETKLTTDAHVEAAKQAGIGTREHAAQAGRIADMEKARMNDEKLLLDFQNNKLVFHSPVIAYGPDNKSIRDPELGLLKMLDTNKKIHPEYRDAAVQIWNERESHVRDVMNQMFKDKKGPQYDPTKINDLKSEVGKTRKSLLKAWEDRRLESLRKKVQVY